MGRSRSWRSSRRSTAKRARRVHPQSSNSSRPSVFSNVLRQCTTGTRAREKGPAPKTCGPVSLLRVASVFTALFSPVGDAPLSMPRFQFAPVASSNSSRTATLHSSVLLVGLGLFFYRSSDFFSFRVVSNFSLARGFLAMLCVVVYLVFAFVCFSHGGHSQPRADPQQKPRIF